MFFLLKKSYLCRDAWTHILTLTSRVHLHQILRYSPSLSLFLLDFAEPLTLPSMIDPGPSTSDSPMGATPLGNSPPEESVSILTSMGFPRAHSIQALKATVSLLPTMCTNK